MKTIWVPTKETFVVVKADGKKINDVDQSMAFEEKPLGVSKPGFGK